MINRNKTKQRNTSHCHFHLSLFIFVFIYFIAPISFSRFSESPGRPCEIVATMAHLISDAIQTRQISPPPTCPPLSVSASKAKSFLNDQPQRPAVPFGDRNTWGATPFYFVSCVRFWATGVKVAVSIRKCGVLAQMCECAIPLHVMNLHIRHRLISPLRGPNMGRLSYRRTPGRLEYQAGRTAENKLSLAAIMA